MPGMRRRRRGLLVIDGAHLAVGHADQHVSAAAQIACFGMDHGQRECHRHRRIHRIAALAQNLQPGSRGNLVGAGDHGFGARSGSLTMGRGAFSSRPLCETS